MKKKITKPELKKKQKTAGDEEVKERIRSLIE